MTERLTQWPGDALILLRADGEILVSLKPDGAELNRANLLAVGLKMCLENDDWSDRLAEKAKEYVSENLKERLPTRTDAGVGSVQEGGGAKDADD